ncbi:AAA family ATPase [Sinorhizobium meliloti]|nr:AAA family ATPase [Sinorhizobium meliloti]MDW9912877.1 AAA family ATPase [Sinorhizobium meliloti]MDW9943979.1 AAA family ATPase [Sinorhizobium meliloti]
MALMWPKCLRAEIRRNPLRRAEVELYDLLGATLPDAWVVWYSRPWLGLTSTGAEKDGEADFIIAHPDRGYLSLEVKGGAISYDPALDHWTSRDRDGIVHTIKNPIAQARSSKHEILRKLKAARGWPGRRIRIRHGVVFPDSIVPRQALGADSPREIFCDASEMRGNLRGWIEGRLGRPDPAEHETALGSSGVELLNQILAYPISLRVPEAVLIENDERTFRELTVQQFHLISMLAEVPRAAVAGAAGTGKTIIAMEKARRSAASGHRTLFTCFNRPLAEFVGRQLGGEGLDVATFHSLCSKAAAGAGLPVPSGVQQQELMNNVLPGLLLDATSLPGWQPYDVVVVDEGQDFMPHWWPALDSSLANGRSGHFYVFYDDNQSVYGSARSLPSDAGLTPFRLSRNLRNTQRIHEAASRHYRGAVVEAIGPSGVDVSWVNAESPAARRRELDGLVKGLCGIERVLPDEIGVLVMNESEIAVYAEAGRVGTHVAMRLDQVHAESITIDTVRRFKGLERQVIILVASEAILEEPELAYVALSRPRSRLFVIGSTRALGFLKSLGGSAA